MPHALLIGGTRFIGRHTVEAFREADYAVTTFTRGEHPDPFRDRDGVVNRTGDRNDRESLAATRDAVDPDVVVDLVGYVPAQVEAACELFADVDAYVFVSSGSAYGEEAIPMREAGTALEACTPEQATDESMETYGARKAECDRTVFAAAENRRFSRSRNADGVSATAERGVNALSVRPMLVYGPHDYTERTDYWFDRVNRFDRVLVPGDGDSLLHRAYVEDVARAIRVVAERGDPGEAYNVADRDAVSLDRSLRLAGEALGTDVELVHASERELAADGLSAADFPLYTDRPMLADTGRLADLGWKSTTLETAFARTAADHLDAARDGRDLGPSRADETRAIESLSG